MFQSTNFLCTAIFPSLYNIDIVDLFDSRHHDLEHNKKQQFFTKQE